MGRWILWGWVALAVIVVGLVLGFVLYTRIVIGIGLQDQRALLHLPETLIVQRKKRPSPCEVVWKWMSPSSTMPCRYH